MNSVRTIYKAITLLGFLGQVPFLFPAILSRQKNMTLPVWKCLCQALRYVLYLCENFA